MFTSRKSRSLHGTILQEKINELHHYFMPMDLNTAFHQSKVNAIKKIKFVLNHASRRSLQESDFEELLLCSLTLVYYFGMRLKLSRLTSRYWFWCGKRLFHRAESVFQKTMDHLQPERSEATIKITLNFFSEVSLWPFESFVGQILEVVLYFNRGKTKLFNMMLTDIHCVLFKDVKSARHRMRVLYELLKSDNWVIDKQKLLPFITRLLDFFAYSISRDSKTTAYGYLRKGFEVCLRRIFERVDNQHRVVIITTMLNWFSLVSMNDDDVLEFSLLLDHAAELYHVDSYSDSFKEGLIEHVLTNLVGSSYALYSLVGCRLLQRFLDRQHNDAYLSVPTLYYEFTQVKLKIGKCDNPDKIFIRQHREKLHEYILKAVKEHCNNAVNLKAVFSVICCIVLEVPCGLTAAAAACMVMTVQDFAINGENLLATSRYWMHAIVISVMSLICWVHKAPVLYRYVGQIIARRAKEAPQLNPPLSQTYNIGHHHVTWNKPTLFFEDWELRYALWKHFQETRRHSKRKEFLAEPKE
ncbi:uncharacterized protein LOC114360344 [Ostrinia furnacalis]|uniref:uncharacterized protein LOC114360344 n=1 Tax=Ostrinia furnacalis TaxID=93504 RepID=UPI0010390F46|nr:uncharacterized protein LOC114360344 [Ostrinia furnacalis]